MTKYLKPNQHYIDLYDELTIKDCRWRENFHNDFESNEKYEGKVNKEMNKTFSSIALHFDLLYTTVDHYEKKEKTIQEWIERDRRKDEFYENAKAPSGIRCLNCQSTLIESNKMLCDHHGNQERVLFMYDCPNNCLPHRAFFDDGEEYKPKKNLCPKCKSVLERERERIEDKKIITIETCNNCDYKETDEFDLTMKEDPIDPEYEKDKERFCLSGKRLDDNLKEKLKLDQMSEFMDKWKEKEEYKDEYSEIEKLKKLTVVSLEELLIPLCEKAKYVKFHFGEPEMGINLILPFTVHDADPERIDKDSSYELKNIIKKALSDTNWRLMTDGISYRMGILTGRLRAYEKEEDLLELGKKRLKKT